jgi:hypothetical protein
MLSMTNLDAITGQPFPVADGYYLRCRQCDWHKKLRGSVLTPFRYPPEPTYTYHDGFGNCPSCGAKLADLIFAVHAGTVVYVVIDHELRVSARLEELDPQLYATLRASLIDSTRRSNTPGIQVRVEPTEEGG